MTDKLISWVEKQLEIKDMSQRELGRRSGYSHSLISNALRGARPVTVDFCKAVSKGLQEPIWNVLIMGGILEEVPKEIVESEEIRVLIMKFNELSENNKEDLLNYLDFLLIKQRKP